MSVLKKEPDFIGKDVNISLTNRKIIAGKVVNMTNHFLVLESNVGEPENQYFINRMNICYVRVPKETETDE